MVRTSTGKAVARKEIREPSRLSEVQFSEETRIISGIEELDRVLGGGIVVGSLVLVGGDPGIGKSTLLLQMCQKLVQQSRKVLYVSGEESEKQIKMRAERLGVFQSDLLVMSETDLDIVAETITRSAPDVVIIDSIQTMYREEIGSAPGSVGQVRETTSTLLRLAKGMSVSIFIVGHVTKEGVVAGPRVLEHMVDTVLYFEGDGGASYRFLRGVKNRFGSTNEVGVFEMRGSGLVEVSNPSEFMLQGKPEDAPGSVVACSMEGTRPILVEVQGLVCQTNFNYPKRTAAGIDFNRVNLLLAVLEKRLGVRMNDMDAYINVVGGLRLDEPASDLSVALALVSNLTDRLIPDDLIAIGEIGLAGEVRAVNHIQNRVSEAYRLGFVRCMVPRHNLSQLNTEQMPDLEVIPVSSINEACKIIGRNKTE